MRSSRGSLSESPELLLSGKTRRHSVGIVKSSDVVPLDQLSSRRKKIVVACLAANNVLLNMCLSVMAPVFPLEVKKNFPHQSAHHGFAIGMVFSAATISDFLFAPIVGRQIPVVGARRTLCLGVVLVSGVIFLFGFVAKLYDWHMFLGFCYALRLTQGIGTAMVFASSFSLLAGTHPDSVALMSGLLELFSGLGFMIGPSLGGVLYEHGGFSIPFWVMSAMLALALGLVFVNLPRTEPGNGESESFPLTQIIRRPRPLILLFVNFYCLLALSFFDPTLSVYLSKFDLKPGAIGGIFLLGPGLYTLLAPLIGYIADHYFRKPLLLAGLIVTALGYELMGPQTVFDLTPRLYIILIGYAVIGLGVGWAFIPVSSDILDTMRKAGYSDSLELHSTIGGMLGASFSFGLTIGPILGGMVSPTFTFNDGMAWLGAGHAILFIILLVQTLWSLRSSRAEIVALPGSMDERTPLVQDDNTGSF